MAYNAIWGYTWQQQYPCQRLPIIPLPAVDVARAGQKQFPGQSALLKARTHAYSTLCRRQGCRRVLLARGRRKPVDPLPSACSYMRFAHGSGIRIGVRQRRGFLIVDCCRSVHGRLPLYTGLEAKQLVGQRNPEVKRDYACDQARFPTRGTT